MSDLRAGVVGAGVFGGYHANKYAALEGVALVGVLDADPQRGEALAGKLGAEAFTDPAAFFDGLDVVTIAAPASAHAEIAALALRSGVHAYVEKPLAPSVSEGRFLVELAQAQRLVLAAGHQERAIFRAMGLLEAPERPVRIEAVRRSSYYPGRGTDVSCGLDMMIHDYDLALALNPSTPTSVAATGRIAHGPRLDEIFTEIVFDDGMVLTVDGSRLDDARKRTMKIVYPSGVVAVDFMAKTFSNTTPFPLNPDYAETPDGKDPLGASVQGFLDAVRGTAPRPLVTGAEALRALDLALKVDEAVQPAA
ncbi:MAG TPA: Gfo/Idh/MocA family oxidoreductase [Caulobacteraceae bacterium]|nr:Gfo/Idh/MocA family oxidoreductase [Caulobacteraceae bacterium]